ncbi:MAG: hypothetical protein Q9223_001951 [Gallowayella weberi]
MARGVRKQRGDGPRSKGRSQGADDGINAAYRDMLAEVNSSPTQTSDEGRALKRRRVRGRIIAQQDDASLPDKSQRAVVESLNAPHQDTDHSAQCPQGIHPLPQDQTAYNDTSSEESDFAWEDVRVPHQRDQQLEVQPEEEGQQMLNLILDDEGEKDSSLSAARRKPLTAVERKLRLEVHKVHLLCLLSHVHLRNHWCNDQNIHKTLYRRFPKQIVSLLNPDEKHSHFSQDQSFKEGLKRACSFFQNAFKVTARGMSRSYWVEDSESVPPQPPSDLDVVLQKSDLLDCANSFEGSRDIGTQLFCALLRSAGVETRLVCSLQVLPLVAIAKGTVPQKPPVRPMPIINHNLPSSDDESDQQPTNSERDSSTPFKRPIGSTGGLTRFADPNAPQPPSKSAARPAPARTSKPFRQSAYPVYWLEIYNPFSQRYTPLDSLVTHTIGKPSALAPPLSDPLNNLTYVIAFNDDLTAKDVTRRYTRAYNAKILRQRVDLSPKGKTWLSTVLALFRYRGRRPSAKDDLEDVELAKKEAAEPMPRNIQDFKNHPVYALERHLHRNEIIHPRQEIGRVGTGTGSKNEGKLEPVFRRKDVLVCRTADQWFRVGREIKPGEQPLKRLLPSKPPSLKRGRRSISPDEGSQDEGRGIKTLYAPHQTIQYVPPPIPERGYPIPRNAFKNLDVYVPSMVPARGWHSVHPLTATAAKILGIDHVPAVTGFSFTGGGKGRIRGSATVRGAVIWEGHREAVDAVIEGLADLVKDEEEERWRAVLWAMWRKMIRGLRVRERVKGYQIEGEDAGGVQDSESTEESEEVQDEDDDEEGGGFLSERRVGEAMRTGSRRNGARTGGRRMLLDSESEDEDVYVPSDVENNSTTIERNIPQAPKTSQSDRMSVDKSSIKLTPDDNAEDSEGGGFLLDEHDGGGGFIPDDDPEDRGDFVVETAPTSRNPQVHDNEEKEPINTNHSGSSNLQDPPPTTHMTNEVNPSLLPDTPINKEQIALKNLSTQIGPEETVTESPTVPPFAGLSEEELAEARMLEDFYAKGKAAGDDGCDMVETTLLPDKTVGTSNLEDTVLPDEAPTQAEFGPMVSGLQRSDPSDEEDKGSLLSEDPEDEDAEPDWIA